MAKDLIDASILHLRARALEQFSIIKGILRSPTQEQDMEKLSAHVLKLSQLENGMVTLQQYSPHLIEAAEQAVTQVEVEEDEDSEADPPEPADPITRAQSPLLRNDRGEEITTKEKDES
jgi:hypothetical protein